MTSYLLLKFLHLIGAITLIGTGAGIAFFMVMAHATGNVSKIAGVARIVVIADFAFTATAVVIQPLTGIFLALEVGYPLTEGWIILSTILYVFVGIFWIPVIFIQIRMRDLAEDAETIGQPLPRQYYQLFWTWFAFGFPAFSAILGILWLMIARPDVTLFG